MILTLRSRLSLQVNFAGACGGLGGGGLGGGGLGGGFFLPLPLCCWWLGPGPGFGIACGFGGGFDCGYASANGGGAA